MVDVEIDDLLDYLILEVLSEQEGVLANTKIGPGRWRIALSRDGGRGIEAFEVSVASTARHDLD